MPARKQLIQMQSEYLNRDVLVGVVVPEKIDKIMLLLHGFNGTFKHLEDNLPLEEYANDYNMLLVTPNMNNGYYLSKRNYCVNDFFLRELVPLVIEKLDLRSDFAMYIAGISMGGYGSLLIGSSFPDKFKKIISISGAFIAHDVAIGNPQVVGMANDHETLRFIMDTFSPFDSLESDILRNPIAAVINCKEDIISKLIITCGTDDELFERNLDAISQFGKCSVEYDWYPIEGGLHDYKSFDVGLRYAFQML